MVKSWNRPEVPRLPGRGEIPRIWDTASSQLVSAQPAGAAAGIYVCGITPYDSTHIGHAATYLSYDILIRLWLDAGLDVTYVQNTTDVDDPLLERARETGVDWRALAAEQTERFRTDMQALRILPPDHYIAVTERIDEISHAVELLLERDVAYRVGDDVYFDSAAAARIAPWKLGDESHYDRALMLALSAERGGDPVRPGKRDALDPLLWRAARPGDPRWPSAIGDGRPGWHIECSVIAAEFLDQPITVNGGGADLIFPHHEFSAGHASALSGLPFASIHSHAGLVAYRGQKMSKSLGNLVLIGDLTAQGIDGSAIRLALLAERYRTDWEWTDVQLEAAVERLARWTSWASGATEGESGLLPLLRSALVGDLDTVRALAIVDAAVASGDPATSGDLAAIDALLGVELS
jgi:L-cysteine:1D-myo-inositol 2-amino-2-deoxy-alpha-D-glucopyranoside ligase